MAYYIEASSFAGRVDEIENLLNTININQDLAMLNTPSGKISLRQARENALKNVSNFLSILGYDPDPQKGLDQLNAAIQRFHQTTTAFNGLELRARVIEPLRGKVIDTALLEQKKFQDALRTHFREGSAFFQEIIDQVIDELGLVENLNSNPGSATYREAIQILANEIMAQLQSAITLDLTNGTTTISNTKNSLDTSTFSNKIQQAVRDAIQGDSARIRQIFDKKGEMEFKTGFARLAQARGIHIDWLVGDQTFKSNLTVQSSGDAAVLYYDFITPYMNKMTPINGTIAEKSAREYFNSHPEEIPKFYQDAENYFMQFLNMGALTGNEAECLKSAFRQALHSILDNYPATFFTGRNDQAIIGIFGELQGMYYLYSILGENTTLSVPDIAWIGGDTTAGSGAKTGADLIVKIGEQLGYGIQVKNSMELTRSTGFSDFVLSGDSLGNVKGFMSQMVKLGIDPAIVECIEEIMTMKSFNIGYRLEGKRAVEKNPLPIAGTEIYQSAYNKLDDLIDKANKLMALAAAAIMRIQYTQDMDFSENNTLWLIGGAAMVSSVQILDDLIKQIDGIDGNKLAATVSTKLGDKNYNIVDYLNGAGGISNLKTILSTSYNFHKVNK